MLSQKLKQIVLWGKGFGLNGKNTLIFDNCLVRANSKTELIFNYDCIHSGLTSVATFDRGFIQESQITDMPDTLQESK